ncbi:hypothetical protein BH11CYA1_BH11CYA1_10430 [soil metagenome]
MTNANSTARLDAPLAPEAAESIKAGPMSHAYQEVASNLNEHINNAAVKEQTKALVDGKVLPDFAIGMHKNPGEPIIHGGGFITDAPMPPTGGNDGPSRPGVVVDTAPGDRTPGKPHKGDLSIPLPKGQGKFELHDAKPL